MIYIEFRQSNNIVVFLDYVIFFNIFVLFLHSTHTLSYYVGLYKKALLFIKQGMHPHAAYCVL